MRIKKTSELSDDLHKQRTEIINKILPRGGCVLEIGPNVTLLQYDRKECDIISLDVNRHVRPTVVANTEVLPFRDFTFDFIIATEVIEHVRRPKLMLDEIKRVIKTKGQILISTPNVAHLTNRLGMLLMGDFYDDRNIHDSTDVGHIHFFTRRYFLHVLDDLGYKRIKVWDHFIPVSPSHYIDGKLVSTLFSNLTKQTVVLCQVSK